MRLPTLLLALCLAAPWCAAAPLTLVRVWPGYRDAASFERISEYFGKPENPEAAHTLRTQPGQRAGFYFLVRLKNPGPVLPRARFVLQVVSPSSTTPKAYTFESAIPAGSTAFNLGITGADWPEHPKDQPVAWQLSLVSADGAELLQTQSFLWSQPDKK